jgi:Zn-dependent membrane protease YugP
MYIFVLICLGASFLVGWIFKRKFNEYSQIPSAGGLSGKEVAEKMLRDNHIYDVQVNLADSILSDHYNPADKTVNLSPDVYNGRSVAAAAVAAHECGHAVQHSVAYAGLKMRSALVPFVSVTSNYMSWILLAGVLTLNVFPYLLMIGVALFALSTLFSFITLPVEFDASNRAIAWLKTSNTTTQEETDMATNALKWAGMTYVVAALASLATLLYYLGILNRRS